MVSAAPGARHIVLVLHDFAAGGSERVAVRLANRWAAAGRRVTILCGHGVGPARAGLDPGIAVREVSPPIRRGPLSALRLGLMLAATVRALRPDVLVAPGNFHAPVLWGLNAVLGRAAPPSALKVSNPLYRPQRSPLRQRLFGGWFRFITRDCDALAAMSPALARDVRRITGRRDIASLREPNVEDGWTPPAPRARTGPIVCAGRLAPQKNLALALRTFAALPGPRRLQVLGDGPQRGELEALARELGIARRVDFLGHVAEAAPYLRAAGALLSTSHYEGWPAVFTEALAAGAPVVTTDCTPALPEILLDPSFGVVAVDEPAALAAALAHVLNGTGPAPGPLAELARRHEHTAAADAWLDFLDGLVARGP